MQINAKIFHIKKKIAFFIALDIMDLRTNMRARVTMIAALICNNKRGGGLS